MMVTSPVDAVRRLSRAQVAAMSRAWWVLLVTGIVSVLAGAVIFFISWTVQDLVVFVGTLLIVRGLLTMLSIPIDGSVRTWSIVLGVIEVFVGVGVFVWPGPALLVVAFSIGWLLVFRGTMAIIGAVMGRAVMPYWGLVLVAGIIEVLVALYLLSRPEVTLLALVFAVGFTAMLYGLLEIVAAFEVKKLPERVDQLTGEHPGPDHNTLEAVG
ncbi:DUF308 domain-containing protein [Intrasporangium mesophilum]